MLLTDLALAFGEPLILGAKRLDKIAGNAHAHTTAFVVYLDRWWVLLYTESWPE